MALCARLDYFHDAQAGAQGQQFREELMRKIEKWLEPPPPRQVKPLPPPILIPKKRRGGARSAAPPHYPPPTTNTTTLCRAPQATTPEFML